MPSDFHGARSAGGVRTVALRMHSWNVWGSSDEEALIALDRFGSELMVGQYGPDGRFDAVTDPFAQWPAHLTPKSQWSYAAYYKSGLVEKASFRVVGVEWVRTPIADFEAYKVQYSREMRGGGSEYGVNWITPEYPEGVKTDFFTTTGSGTSEVTAHVVAGLSKVNERKI